MKYNIIILLVLGVLVGGCSDEWLNDVNPQGEFLESNYYKSEEDMDKAMVAIYNSLKNQYYQGVWASWYLMGGLPSDDEVCHGGGRSDRPEFWESHDYTWTPSTLGLLQSWNRCYYGINRANVVLERVPDDGEPLNVRARAEASMLRAYFYFDLVRLWGEVPLVDHVLTPDEYEMAKSPKADIFNLIVGDLQTAAAGLPVAWEGAERYRMTKYAAHGLLGKVYMYMASPFYNLGENYYNEAITQFEMVINQGPYELEADYADVHGYWNEWNAETLIEISYGFTDVNDRWDNGEDGTGNVVQQLQGPRGITGGNDTIKGGWGFDQPTRDLVAAFRTQGDSVRLHATALAEWQINEWGYELGASDAKNDAFQGFYSMKRMTWTGLNPNGANWGWGNNERMLRLADIYLLYAEALERTGSNAAAITAANMTRTRAGLGSIEDVMSAQSIDLYAAIKLERRLELALEMNRWFDLVRWMDDVEVLNAWAADPANDVRGTYEAFRRHYPIPQEEIQVSNGKLIQADGY